MIYMFITIKCCNGNIINCLWQRQAAIDQDLISEIRLPEKLAEHSNYFYLYR